MRIRPLSFPSCRAPAYRRGRAAPLLLGLFALLALVGWRVIAHVQAQTALREHTGAAAVPTVLATTPTRGAASDDLVLPGTLQAWSEAPIYARTGGYLKRWRIDIGQPVKAGQLLAEIEAPEVDQQLRQAEADLATAEANHKLAQGTAERYRQLLPLQAVAPQEAEEKFGEAQARQAAVASARANVQRLRELQSFERILAPFDGVVTARNTDIGALIVPGGASGQALFRVAATHKLRVYVEIPEALVPRIAIKQAAELRLAAQPRKTYAAHVIATAAAITPASRTLLTQLEADNAKGELLPGAYAEVRFKLPPQGDVLRIPSNALLFRGDGLTVAVVDANNRVTLKPVTQGRDFGKEVEILAGLQADERIILNPPDSAANGSEVRVVQPKPSAAPATTAARSPAK